MKSCGVLSDGSTVHEISLRQSSGLELDVITYGGIITALKVPDRQGRLANVVLGHDTLRGYLDDRQYLGAIAGRYANRICRGRFALHGRTYQLDVNDGAHHLHGGLEGYNRRLWQIDAESRTAVTLSLVDQAGTCGYPGTVHAWVRYELAADGELRIDYRAETDTPTILNLTQHSYFNLDGDPSGRIDDHVLLIDADHYTPVDDQLIPTGTLAPVDGTPFDFRQGRPIGPTNYDHNWVLNNPGALREVARLSSSASGISMDVLTTEPGLQFYSGHLLDSPRRGLCLETQHFPDSPNRQSFPSTVLSPGATFSSTTIYRFFV